MLSFDVCRGKSKNISGYGSIFCCLTSLHLLTCLVDMVEHPLSVCGCHNVIKNPAPPIGFFVRFWLRHIT